MAVVIPERARKALERIGLTGHETKAYAALLGKDAEGEAGGMTAAGVSGESGIPQSKIYDILGSLEEKGWAGSDDSRPTLYYPKSPATGLETARRRADAEFAEMGRVVSSELLPLYEMSGASERPEIWFLSGAASIAAKILEMVDTCRSDVRIAVPKASESLVRQALPRLRQLRDRGVTITVLASGSISADSLRSLSRVVTSVRTRDGLFAGGIIADGRYVVILLGHEMGESSSAGTVAIWADHAGLAGFALEYFEYLLKDSEVV